MNHKCLILFIVLIGLVHKNYAQEKQKTDTIIHKLDSLSKKTDSAGSQKNNIGQKAYNDTTKLSVRDYFILLGSDLKQGFTKPFHMIGKDWGKLGIFTGIALVAGLSDETLQRNALDWRTKSSTVRHVGNYVSRFGGLYEIYSLAGFGLYGYVFKNQKMKTTTLLASQAYITGGIIESVLKTFSGRTRPDYYGPYSEAEPTFTGPFGNTSKNAAGQRSNSSFPSGHTTVAFAAATVFAKEYADRKIVPIIAYTAATLIGVSRITENKHWTSDVLVGAALGYLTGRLVVNNYHRLAQIKTQALERSRSRSSKHSKQTKVAFNMQYNFGKLMPEIIYSF